MSPDEERQETHDRRPDTARSDARQVEEDEEISVDERQAIEQSEEWFRRNEGIPFERIVAELGLSMEQVREGRMRDSNDRAH